MSRFPRVSLPWIIIPPVVYGVFLSLSIRSGKDSLLWIMWPAYAMGFPGGHSAWGLAFLINLIIVSAIGGLASFAPNCGFRLLSIGIMFVAMGFAGEWNFQRRAEQTRQLVADRLTEERRILSDPNVDYSAVMQRMKDDGRPLDFFYMMMHHPEPSKRAVPFLKEFLAQVRKSNQKSVEGKVAAQALFKITGERLPYPGLERDMDLFKRGISSDPHDPDNFQRTWKPSD